MREMQRACAENVHRLIFLLPRANGRSNRAFGTGRDRACSLTHSQIGVTIHEQREGAAIEMGLALGKAALEKHGSGRS
jgi:hypothetical protein